MESRKKLGNLGEEFAAGMLIAEGFEILEQQYRCKTGEIDIIARKQGEITFAEVKTRTDDFGGYPAEAVTNLKKNKIRSTAELYMQSYLGDWDTLSFQVIEITVNQIENAF